MNMNMLFYIVLLLPFFSCQKEKVSIPEDPDMPIDTSCVFGCDTISSNLKIVWQAPIGIVDTSFQTAGRILLSDAYFSTTRFFRGPDNIVAPRDLQTGELLWTWSDPVELADGSSIGDIDHTQDKMVVCGWSDIFVINTHLGQTEWKTDVKTMNGSGGVRISLIEDFVYHIHFNKIPNPDYTYLVRSPIQHPQWDTLFSISKEENGGYASGIEPPVLWMHPNGDSILVFHNRQHNFSTSHPRGGVYAFNLSQDTLLWSLEGYNPARGLTPYVYDNKIYSEGNGVGCLDAFTGEVLWEKRFGIPNENTGSGSVLVADDKLIVKTVEHTIYALDPNTGAQIWRTEDAGSTPTPIQYYNGAVYYSSIGKGKIFGVDVQTGEVILEERSPNRSDFPAATFTWSGVRIDQETGYLYTADGHFVMCVDLKE